MTKPISWLELIKLKSSEEKGLALKDVMKLAKKDWDMIKAGTHSLYTQGKSVITRKKKNTDNNKKSRKNTKNASASSSAPASSSASSASSSASAADFEEILNQVKLCGKCKKKVDQILKKKKSSGGCGGSCTL